MENIAADPDAEPGGRNRKQTYYEKNTFLFFREFC